MDEEKNVYKKSEKFVLQKKSHRNWEKNHEKSIFGKFFKKIVFFKSNFNLECSKLSFDIHIVHVDQKWRIFKNCSTES